MDRSQPSSSDNSEPVRNPPADERQRLLLLTGMSGAGKSTALDVLEDLGWETIDNFPIRMLDRLVGEPAADDGADVQRGPLAIGFDSRTRGFVPADIIDLVGTLSERGDLALTFVFVDCADHELVRRYNETRRRHPMAQERVHDGIAAERELFESLRRRAEVVIDTSQMSANDLQNRVRDLFADDAPAQMAVTVSSFGFARGMPPLADLVFDMRFLDNPHWIESLRDLTGEDEAVADHIRSDPAFEQVFDQVRRLLLTVLPRYEAQGKSYVHVAFGCTGGRHRSVFTARSMAEALREAGFSPTVHHRNLGSRVADEIESERR